MIVSAGARLKAHPAQDGWRLPDLARGAKAWTALRLGVPTGMLPPEGQLLRVAVRGRSLEGEAVKLERAGLALRVLPRPQWAALPKDELVGRRLDGLAAAEAMTAMRIGAGQGDWTRVEQLLADTRRRFAGNPWVAVVLDAMQELAANSRVGRSALHSAPSRECQTMTLRMHTLQWGRIVRSNEGDCPSLDETRGRQADARAAHASARGGDAWVRRMCGACIASSCAHTMTNSDGLEDRVNQVQVISDLLDVPSGILDAIGRLLAAVGLSLPALWLQIFLLVLVGALAVPLLKQYRVAAKAAKAKRSRKPLALPLLEIVVLALVVVGILVGVVDNATTPTRVGGQLASSRLADARLALLDYRDQVISLDSGLVDTVTGRFALHYSPLMEGHARKLRITAAGCKTQEQALPRAQLRAGSEVTVEHQCAA